MDFALTEVVREILNVFRLGGGPTPPPPPPPNPPPPPPPRGGPPPPAPGSGSACAVYAHYRSAELLQ
ncbi:hypothetical protein WC434_07090, partial [Bordetella avium]|uniref:hypothetical protein n=1 Tax=Bordetella avium TaxID=521 RepID=UPI00307D6C41